MADPRKLADQQKRQRLALERVQAEQILAEYQRVWARIKSDLDVLTSKIRAAQAEGTAVTRGWLIQQHILDTILVQVRAEMDVAAQQIGRTLTQQQAQAVVDAQKDATNLIQANMPPSMVWEPKFPAAAFGELVGYAQDGQPLGDLLAELGPAAAGSIRQSLLHGVALGQNPKQIARGVRSALGGNMARAVTIARTEVLRAHREASRATYQANRDVVTEWVWYAELDGRTCAVCWALHGDVFDTDEMMETHPNCRCALLPRTKSWDELGFPGLKDTRVTVEPGADVFAKASEELQRQVLGPGKFEAYQAGDISLADLVVKTYSERWGGGRRERSLSDLLA